MDKVAYTCASGRRTTTTPMTDRCLAIKSDGKSAGEPNQRAMLTVSCDSPSNSAAAGH